MSLYLGKQEVPGINIGGGTDNHDMLVNRDLPDQHPIDSITGLREELNNKQEAGDYATKADLPKELPNPNALTFTGAATGSYDGSAPLKIHIPKDGGGGGTGEHDDLSPESRALPDQHPIGAITGLREELNGKQEKIFVIRALDRNTADHTHLEALEAQKKGIKVEFHYIEGGIYPMAGANSNFAGFAYDYINSELAREWEIVLIGNKYERRIHTFSQSAFKTPADIPSEITDVTSGNVQALINSLARNKADIKDIPTKLPNPNSITFTGGATGSYDGSSALEVHVPTTDEIINALPKWKWGAF